MYQQISRCRVASMKQCFKSALFIVFQSHCKKNLKLRFGFNIVGLSIRGRLKVWQHCSINLP